MYQDFRKFFYKSCEVVKSPQGMYTISASKSLGCSTKIILCINHNFCAAVLEKWEVPPINEVNRKLEKIEKAIKRHDDAIEDMR